MSPSQLIALLNSLATGDLESLKSRLDEAAAACAALGQDELVATLGEARASLLVGDLRTFRRRVEKVVSKLGHLR